MSTNDKRLRFAAAYHLDPNGTKAAITAGYSPRTAAPQASRLLRSPIVQAELARLRSASAEATGVTPDMVIAELARIGFAKITDVVIWRSNVHEMGEVRNADGEDELVLNVVNHVQFIDSEKLRPEIVAAIAEVSKSSTGAIKIKMHDKIAALVKLGLHLGLFNRVEKPASPGKKEIAQAHADLPPDPKSGWSDLVH